MSKEDIKKVGETWEQSKVIVFLDENDKEISMIFNKLTISNDLISFETSNNTYIIPISRLIKIKGFEFKEVLE